MKFLTVLLLGMAASWSVAQDKWAAANSATLRLPPAAFSRLPKNIVKHLQGRGCMVPQSYLSREPHNVITGEFARRGQTDWAVLCSRSGVSSILIFWRGSTKSVSEVAKAPDSSFLQTVSEGGKVAFSRAIEPVGRDYIQSRYKEYGGRKPPRITHQGINDAYVDKASVVLYYHHGKWLELQGAD
jgi:hypothetical protein